MVQQAKPLALRPASEINISSSSAAPLLLKLPVHVHGRAREGDLSSWTITADVGGLDKFPALGFNLTQISLLDYLRSKSENERYLSPCLSSF